MNGTCIIAKILGSSIQCELLEIVAFSCIVATTKKKCWCCRVNIPCLSAGSLASRSVDGAKMIC